MAVKYDFKILEGTTDTIVLTYEKNNEKKEIKFDRTINLAKELEGINAKARINLYKSLSEQGLSKNDFVIKRENADGSVTYDETNYLELEKKFTEQAQVEVVNAVITKLFKMDILTFISTFELQKSEDQTKFMNKLVAVLGKSDNEIPSEKQ